MHLKEEASPGSYKSRKKKWPLNAANKSSSIGTLRGLQWRLRLDVLPSQSSTIEELRQAAADGRRRYAEFRRRLLVDPHAMEDPLRSRQSDLDNPLSQNPDSVWSRYFQNAELERTIDTDLTRLYPEHGSFFQNPVCQAMLRRILLVWSLMHPQYSYRQGMHELLAPLVYVLQIDVLHLSKVKHRYEDLFDDRFEGPCLFEAKFCDNGRGRSGQLTAFSKTAAAKEASGTQGKEEWLESRTPQDRPHLEMDESGFDLKFMVVGSEIYGAEGELGALLSGRFVEHDAFSMFDALMSGRGGMDMADFFLAPVGTNLGSSLSSVLEASSLLYRVLAAADLSLYNHLTGLGVEPQFFAMRWLRVLFGREFDLEKILSLWDAIFAVENSLVGGDNSGIHSSPRRDFILAFGTSMLLFLKSALLATPSATDCLKKLLNFPQTAEISTLIESAKILRPLVDEATRFMPHSGQLMRIYENAKSRASVQTGNNSPLYGHKGSPTSMFTPTRSFPSDILKKPLPDSYWEEKWKKSILQKALPCIDEGRLTAASDSECLGISSSLKQGSQAARKAKGTKRSESRGDKKKASIQLKNDEQKASLFSEVGVTIPTEDFGSSLSKETSAHERAINGEKLMLCQDALGIHSSKESLAKLETLGHCISDNLKVIEEAVFAMPTLESLEDPIKGLQIHGEKPDVHSDCLPGCTIHEAVQAALTELRKLSDALLHM